MQAYRNRGQALTGHSGPHPSAGGLRALAIQVLVQAAKDATASDPWQRQLALEWLNSDCGRGLAEALGLQWPARAKLVTADSLRVPVRHTYFRGD